jgi:hypothetical protein
MNESLYENEKSELERRRLAEAVAKSVEDTLKKRYTWLAIVVSFLLGGGAVFATNQLIKPAERMLTRHEILLSQAEKCRKYRSESQILRGSLFRCSRGCNRTLVGFLMI